MLHGGLVSTLNLSALHLGNFCTNQSGILQIEATLAVLLVALPPLVVLE